ncbi:uncharacterized protein KRP23_7236 [Phytophthora ramorum]|uniref:uncharacterized protein n=1 Tax=Phytophthora ramorum TaxID=164328 RepID=UPI00309ECB40|nr:hypothetical protein KRP23_7236 [Phytophthora ramorum]
MCRAFRDLERQWWASRPTDELQMFVVQFGLQPESMRFFGEVLFLLCGLKACVLLSNLPPTWRQSFANDVVVPSGLLLTTTGSVSPCSVVLYSVGTRLETPAEYELTGDLVLANTQHAEFQLAKHMSVSGLVQEHDLARVLDYPVALSDCNESAPMMEVGYFLEEEQQQVLLTSYCAMATPQHTQRVQQHFQNYQTRSGGVQLVLRKSQI